jgi:hypothetical protein
MWGRWILLAGFILLLAMLAARAIARKARAS